MLEYAAPSAERSFMPPWVAPLLVIALALAMQLFVRRALGEYVERVLLDAGIAVILAVSLNIVNGFTGQFSIGHAAFFAIGGYAAAFLTYYGGLLFISPDWGIANPIAAMLRLDIFFAIATLLGGLAAAGAGWLVGLPSLRLRGDYLAIVTLGFGEIVRVLLQQTNTQFYSRKEMLDAKLGQWLPPPVNGSLGFIDVPKITVLFWAVLAAGATLIVAWRLKHSTFGRSMIAIRENEIAAESMGVNVTRLKVWAFVIGAFFAGVAGSLYAHENGQLLTPGDAGFARSFDVVIMVVLGGLGSISGVTLSAILLTLANEWLRDPTQPTPLFGLSVHVWMIALFVMAVRLIVWPHQRGKAALFWLLLTAALGAAEIIKAKYQVDFGDYRMIVYALVLILTMILRPGGLFGLHEVTDLLAMRRGSPEVAT